VLMCLVANLKSYSETCNIIRHYSSLSFNIRVLSIVQGITLAGAWVLNYENCNLLVLLSLPIFGLLFTYLSHTFHKSYYDTTGFFLTEVSKMEEGLFSESYRPFTEFKVDHDKRFKSTFQKIISINAPFTLNSILFVGQLILTIIKFCNNS